MTDTPNQPTGTEEIYKPIAGAEGFYEVSNLGNVRSIGRGIVLKPSVSMYGYLQLRVMGKCRQVHRYVAETFIPNPLNKPCVNHKDSNRMNNNVNNLEWVTHKENTAHGVKYGHIVFPNFKKPVVYCKIEGCGQPQRGHQLCKKHYWKAWWQEQKLKNVGGTA